MCKVFLSSFVYNSLNLFSVIPVAMQTGIHGRYPCKRGDNMKPNFLFNRLFAEESHIHLYN